MKENSKRFSIFLLAVTLVGLCVTMAWALDPKGRPKGMGPNASSGFYIWQDERGWHLRTIATANQKHHFSGEIIVEGGNLNDAKQYRDEPANWLKTQGNKINIDLNSDRTIDGIDFQANGSLTFNLQVDDRTEPTLIHVGANSDNPSGIPFTLNGR